MTLNGRQPVPDDRDDNLLGPETFYYSVGDSFRRERGAITGGDSVLSTNQVIIEQSQEINSEQIVGVIFEQHQGNQDQHFIQKPRYSDCASSGHGGDKDYRK